MLYKPHTDQPIEILDELASMGIHGSAPAEYYFWNLATFGYAPKSFEESYRPKHTNPVIRSFAQACHTTKRSSIHLHGRSTELVIEHDRASIRYHYTNVVTHLSNGSCLINNGGFYSSTTKKKINEYAPYGINVYQRNFVWYITNRLTDQTIEFTGKVMINPFGIMSKGN